MVVSDMMPPRGIHISINNQDTALHNIYIATKEHCRMLYKAKSWKYLLSFFGRMWCFCNKFQSCSIFGKYPDVFSITAILQRVVDTDKYHLVVNIYFFYLHLLNMVGSEQCINIIFGPLTWIYPENYWGTAFLQRATHSGAPVRNWCNYLRTNSECTNSAPIVTHTRDKTNRQ